MPHCHCTEIRKKKTQRLHRLHRHPGEALLCPLPEPGSLDRAEVH